MSLPKAMRLPRKAKYGHYYIDPTGINIYPESYGTSVVRLTRRQIEQIMQILYDYVPNRAGVKP